MTSYEDLIAAAEHDYARGEFKRAHITFGEALACGGPANYCRRMRGICSRRVGEQRLQKAIDHPDHPAAFLNQAAKWLAKSEANLEAALEDASDGERGQIRLEQARTEETIARFVKMSGGDPERRLAAARSHRQEGLEPLPQP
ncbi:MAG: hypothetical protein H0T70_07505 [Acidimicrobiia bacterium]|nr:hypothetical protein [Acidimicrobiia bacterium]